MYQRQLQKFPKHKQDLLMNSLQRFYLQNDNISDYQYPFR